MHLCREGDAMHRVRDFMSRSGAHGCRVLFLSSYIFHYQCHQWPMSYCPCYTAERSIEEDGLQTGGIFPRHVVGIYFCYCLSSYNWWDGFVTLGKEQKQHQQLGWKAWLISVGLHLTNAVMRMNRIQLSNMPTWYNPCQHCNCLGQVSFGGCLALLFGRSVSHESGPICKWSPLEARTAYHLPWCFGPSIWSVNGDIHTMWFYSYFCVRSLRVISQGNLYSVQRLQEFVSSVLIFFF